MARTGLALAGQRRRRSGAHAEPSGPRHAASSHAGGSHAPPPRTSPGGSHARATPSQAWRRAAARERMLQRRRRSLGALSLLVLAVTVAITLTRPSPQPAAAASQDAVRTARTVPATVYASQAATRPGRGAAANAAAPPS